MSSPLLQEAAEHCNRSLPQALLLSELPATGGGYREKAHAPLRLADAPFARDPALLLEPQQRGIGRALVERERALGHLLDASGDCVPVQRAHDLEGLEDHQVEGAVGHFTGRLVGIHVWTINIWLHMLIVNTYSRCRNPAPKGVDVARAVRGDPWPQVTEETGQLCLLGRADSCGRKRMRIISLPPR